MAVAVQITQISNVAAEVVWTDDGPVSTYTVNRNRDGAGWVQIATGIEDTARRFIDVDPGVATGESYGLQVLASGGGAANATIEWRNLDEPFTYGTIDRLVTAPRYTDAATVKDALGLTNPSPAQDARVLDAIVAGEIGLDVNLGRSFPDTGTNPEWPGIPIDVRMAATQIGIRLYKVLDAPFGTAGSDELIGELDVGEVVRRELQRNPLLRGYMVGFPVSL